MRVVALISGGKDSCYNMIQCVASGHEIVALANLRPENQDELDSYMYQTVGHQGVELYAEAMGLPLFRQLTQGVALLQAQVYTPTPEDEVEDLYQLLKRVKEEVSVDGVAVGAIMSDYQRIRVENVCSRLGLVTLAYLWRRNQEELLQEMIHCQVEAIIIKVAALGLDPKRHLGKSLREFQPLILKLKEKYGLNVCGEGGEYETFTVDCPLFIKTIVIDERETVINSTDDVCPVGYLNLIKFHLVQKNNVNPESNMAERISNIPVKTWKDMIVNLDEDVTESKLISLRMGDCDYSEVKEVTADSPNELTASHIEPLQILREEFMLSYSPTTATNGTGWTWFGGIVGEGEDTEVAIRQVLRRLNTLMLEQTVEVRDLVAVTLYLQDMTQYAGMNDEYIKMFNASNPPVRICVETPLPNGVSVMLEGLSHRDSLEGERHTMHVQGVSHWAPANIGPYSQAVRVNDIIYVAGQIALVPGTMQLVFGGAREQCKLALRHISRIIRAMDPNVQLRDVVQGICYVTHPSYISEAREEWEQRTNNAIVDYIVVPNLPRGALLEWHVWAHRDNNRFEYEETGSRRGDFMVSIRGRWNYENNVSSVVCYVATATPNTSVDISAEDKINHSSEQMTDEQFSDVMSYVLSKLLRQTPTSTVCSLRIFYKVGKGPSPQQIRHILNELEGFVIVHSIVPVCQLLNPNTFLSICGVRHN